MVAVVAVVAVAVAVVAMWPRWRMRLLAGRVLVSGNFTAGCKVARSACYRPSSLSDFGARRDLKLLGFRAFGRGSFPEERFLIQDCFEALPER